MSPMRTRNLARCSGFTLIEVLCASVIAAILMGAVMVSVRVIGKDHRMLKTLRETSNTSAQDAMQMIRHDLTNARRMWPLAGGGMVMTAYSGINQKTLEPNHRLVRVAYLLMGGDLVRRQQYIDGSGEQTWTELVCRDVSQFAIQRVPDPEEVPDPDENGQIPLVAPFPLIPEERLFAPSGSNLSIAGLRASGRVMVSLALNGMRESLSQEIVVR